MTAGPPGWNRRSVVRRPRPPSAASREALQTGSAVQSATRAAEQGPKGRALHLHRACLGGGASTWTTGPIEALIPPCQSIQDRLPFDCPTQSGLLGATLQKTKPNKKSSLELKKKDVCLSSFRGAAAESGIASASRPVVDSKPRKVCLAPTGLEENVRHRLR